MFLLDFHGKILARHGLNWISNNINIEMPLSSFSSSLSFIYKCGLLWFEDLSAIAAALIIATLCFYKKIQKNLFIKHSVKIQWLKAVWLCGRGCRVLPHCRVQMQWSVQHMMIHDREVWEVNKKWSEKPKRHGSYKKLKRSKSAGAKGRSQN